MSEILLWLGLGALAGVVVVQVRSTVDGWRRGARTIKRQVAQARREAEEDPPMNWRFVLLDIGNLAKGEETEIVAVCPDLSEAVARCPEASWTFEQLDNGFLWHHDGVLAVYDLATHEIVALGRVLI